MEPLAQDVYPNLSGLRFYIIKHGVVSHLNVLLHIIHLFAGGET